MNGSENCSILTLVILSQMISGCALILMVVEIDLVICRLKVVNLAHVFVYSSNELVYGACPEGHVPYTIDFRCFYLCPKLYLIL